MYNTSDDKTQALTTCWFTLGGIPMKTNPLAKTLDQSKTTNFNLNEAVTKLAKNNIYSLVVVFMAYTCKYLDWNMLKLYI